MSRKLTIPKILSILTVLPILTMGCGHGGDRGTSPVHSASAITATPPIIVRTDVAMTVALPEVLEVTGALIADQSAEIASERDGLVSAIPIERGTFVDKGAVLARLDDREARALLEQARANASWARADLARFSELREKRVVSSSEKERKEIDRDLAKAGLALAEKALDDCIVRAPFSGLVTDRRASAGGYVHKGQVLAGLVRIDPLRAELAIPEALVSKVRPAQRVTLAVQTFPDTRFEGKITYVGPSLRSEARTLIVEAIVPNPKKQLRPGLFATAQIELPKSEPTLLVPKNAILQDSGISRAFVFGKERVSERIVTIGKSHGDFVEVASGVAPGEQVITTLDRRLTDGLLVQN